MSQNLEVDPATLDYVVPNGSPVPSDRMYEAALIALLIPQGQWMYGDATQGSQIYKLINSKHRGQAQTFEAYAKNALQANVIDEGKASDFEIENLLSSRHSDVHQINMISAKQNQFSDTLPFTPM